MDLTARRKPDYLKILQWTLAFAVLALGAYISWGGRTKWIVIGNLVHALPLISLLLPWRKLRPFMLWFGVFLILQDGFTLYTHRTELYKTLPPRMDSRLEVTGDILRGIKGVQHVTTDDKGFRVSRAIDYNDPAPYRIFAIGASTTEQIYLGDRHTWTHLLQEALGENTEIVNTGLSGLRAEHHLATLQQILPLHPDMAIFLIGINDWNKHIREHFGSRHYQQNKFRYSLAVNAIRNFITALRGRARKAAGLNTPPDSIRPENGDYYRDKMGSLNRARVESWRPDAPDPHYRRTLDKIAAACQRAKIACVFITQPHGYAEDLPQDYTAHFWMTPPGEKFTLDLPSLIHVAGLYNDELQKFACQNGFHSIDLAAWIEPGFQSFYDEVHFNTQGARSVAAALAPAIAAIKAGAAPVPCE